MINLEVLYNISIVVTFALNIIILRKFLGDIRIFDIIILALWSIIPIVNIISTITMFIGITLDIFKNESRDQSNKNAS